MTSFGRTVRIIFSAVALIAIGVVVLVQFTDYCRLKAVTLDGRPVSDFSSRYPLNPTRTIAEQPIEKVASQLLDEHGIVKVNIQYALPCSLRISTNDFTPNCLVVDKSTGYIYGLDTDGRIIPVKDSSQIWNLPLLTGVRMYRLYSFCDDIRTQLLVPELQKLRDENPDEYAMIDEIDFSNLLYLSVLVSGVSYPVKATADDFAEQMHQFFTFVTTYNPDMSAATSVDLRFSPMIVRAGQPPDSTDSVKKAVSASSASVKTPTTEAPDIGHENTAADVKLTSSAAKANETPKPTAEVKPAPPTVKASAPQKQSTNKKPAVAPKSQKSAKSPTAVKSTTKTKSTAAKKASATVKPTKKPGERN